MYNKQWYEENKERVANQRREKRLAPTSISVQCRLCDKTVGVKGLSLHLRLHSITFDAYVEQYFDDFVAFGYERCFQCKTGIARRFKCQDKIRSFCSDTCRANWASIEYKGRTCTNKGYRWTDEQRNRVSEERKGKVGTPHTTDTKYKMSESAKVRAKSPTYVNPMQGKTHTTEAIRKIFSKRSYTSLEIAVADVLTSYNIPYTQQFFLNRDGECYAYDFRISDSNILLEADGDYWHGGPGVTVHHVNVEITKSTDERKNAFAELHGFRVVRVWESEIKTNPSILLERLSS